MNSRKIPIALLTVIPLAGCSIADLRVRSEPPEAEVYFLVPKTNEKKFLAKTPIDIPVGKLEEAIHAPPSSSEFMVLVLERPDYRPETMLIPVGTLGTTSTTVNVRMRLKESEKTKVAEVLQFMVNAQDFLHRADFVRADFELEKALAIEPKNPWAYILRGELYYLQRDYTKSLSSFEKGLDFDPNNQRAVERISEIRKLLANGAQDGKR
jgi:tetratricopeptide (TPR) repeat protein